MPTSPANEEAWEGAGGSVNGVEHVPEGEVAEAREETEPVVALREELDRVRDRHRRALADLDNYRKRAERESDRRVAAARHALLREWLDAVDSVERALRMQPDDPGLTAVLEQMEAILARHGIVRLEGVGARFDPERHEAIAVQATTEAPDHTVVEVARSGFELDDGSVLRPAQVVVAQSSAGQS